MKRVPLVNEMAATYKRTKLLLRRRQRQRPLDNDSPHSSHHPTPSVSGGIPADSSSLFLNNLHKQLVHAAVQTDSSSINNTTLNFNNIPSTSSNSSSEVVQCPACSKFLDSLALLDKHLDNLCKDPPPPPSRSLISTRSTSHEKSLMFGQGCASKNTTSNYNTSNTSKSNPHSFFTRSSLSRPTTNSTLSSLGRFGSGSGTSTVASSQQHTLSSQRKGTTTSNTTIPTSSSLVSKVITIDEEEKKNDYDIEILSATEDELEEAEQEEDDDDDDFVIQNHFPSSSSSSSKSKQQQSHSSSTTKQNHRHHHQVPPPLPPLSLTVPPKLAWDTLKEIQLRPKLAALGLSSHGGKEGMKRRYNQYRKLCLMYLQLSDVGSSSSEERGGGGKVIKTKDQILKEVAVWERGLTGIGSGNILASSSSSSSSSSGFMRGSGDHAITVEDSVKVELHKGEKRGSLGEGGGVNTNRFDVCRKV